MTRSASSSKRKTSAKSSRNGAKNGSANLRFEAKLWLAADKLRNNMDAAEYKHVVLGLIFLKYISDAFEEMRTKLLAGEGEHAGADPEDPDSTQVPVCLWFIARNKSGQPSPRPSPSGRGRSVARDEGQLAGGFRDRRGETLFIDARKLGQLVDRVHHDLTEADLEKIVSTYHAWRCDFSTKNQEQRTKNAAPAYEDLSGFAKSATTEDIAAHSYVLTPGPYVGAEEVEDDGEPFEEKMPRLVAELNAQFAEPAKLEAAIRSNLKGLGYGK